jgi:type I restriction enzyme S subunit
MAADANGRAPTVGSFPPNWPSKRLDTIVEEPVRSGIYVPKNLRGVGSKLVNMGELFGHPRLFDIPMERVPTSHEERRRFSVHVGDLLFARRSMIGTGPSQCSLVCAAEDSTVFESSILRVRSDPNIVFGEFLFYFFWSPRGKHEIESIGRHGPISGITGKDLQTLWVPTPPLPEQRAIASVLGSLDDKIDLNRRMNQTLEEIARALFKFWFVDFSPVRAKAEGRWKKGESLPGMPADMWDLWPSEFEDSEIGKIPKGWRVAGVGGVVAVAGGSTPSTKNPRFWDGPIHWATPKDMAGLSAPALLDTERKLTDAGLAETTSGLLPRGTVLLSSRAPIGYLAITEVPVAVNQGFITMTCGTNPSNHYMLHWARENHEAIIAQANGTTFLEISKGNFRPMKILVPNDELMSKFTQIAQSFHEHVVASLRQTETLASVRDTLLPKLLSGELRISLHQSA